MEKLTATVLVLLLLSDVTQGLVDETMIFAAKPEDAIVEIGKNTFFQCILNIQWQKQIPNWNISVENSSALYNPRNLPLTFEYNGSGLIVHDVNITMHDSTYSCCITVRIPQSTGEIVLKDVCSRPAGTLYIADHESSLGIRQPSFNSHLTILQREGQPVNVPCPFTYNQIWKINGTVYTLSRLPAPYQLSYLGLEFSAHAGLNGTRFQCFGQATDGSLTVEESFPATLHVRSVNSDVYDELDLEDPDNYFGHVIITQRVGRSVTIPCQFKDSRIWKINGVIYGLSNLPPQYKLHYIGLQLDHIDIGHNNTDIVCFTATGDGLEVIPSAPVKLHILVDDENATTPSNDMNRHKLELDYQNTLFRNDIKTIAWINHDPNCSQTSYTIESQSCSNDIPSSKQKYQVTQSDAANKVVDIPSEDFYFTEVDDDGSTDYRIYINISTTFCNIDPLPLVYVHPNETTDTIVVPPGKAGCIPITGNAVLSITWPIHPGGSEYCSCPLCRGIRGCSLPMCECISNLHSKFSVAIRNDTLTGGYKVCWLNMTEEMTNTKVFLFSESRACQPDVVHVMGYSPPYVVPIYFTFETAVCLVVGGIPDVQITDVRISSDNTSGIVCFSATSYDWQPITRYDFAVVDVTGEILYHKNNTSPISFDSCDSMGIKFELDHFRECSPFNITVTAHNEVGVSSNSTSTDWTSTNKEECSCYQAKVSSTVQAVEVGVSSVTIEINCYEDILNSTEIVVQLKSPDHPEYDKNISTLCSRKLRKSFNGLRRNTHYSVVITPQSFENCLIIGSPKTFKTEVLSTVEIIGVAVGCLVVIIMVTALIILMIELLTALFKCKKKKIGQYNGYKTQES